MKTCLVSLAALVIASITLSPQPAGAGCAPTPEVSCKAPFVPHRSSLTFHQIGGHDPDDVYTWRWFAGSETAVADFGDPPTTDYAFCIYDHSPRVQPVVADIPDDPNAWVAGHNGFSYLVRGDNPLRILRLHAGVDGKANIQAHGNSTTLEILLPFVPPVTVQLQAGNGECWETDLAVPARNNAEAFKAKD